jgi:hypothetical protein
MMFGIGGDERGARVSAESRAADLHGGTRPSRGDKKAETGAQKGAARNATFGARKRTATLRHYRRVSSVNILQRPGVLTLRARSATVPETAHIRP